MTAQDAAKVARCDQCQHWADDANDWQVDRAGMRKCQAIKQRWDILEEGTKDADIDDWDAFEAAENAALLAEKAFAADGSDYHAAIYTAPDFFCAKFVRNHLETRDD